MTIGTACVQGFSSGQQPMMRKTWVVVARRTSATLFERNGSLHCLAELEAGPGEAPEHFARRIAARLEREADVRPVGDLVLLTEARMLGPLRLSLSPRLAERLRGASNALSIPEEREALKRLLASALA